VRFAACVFACWACLGLAACGGDDAGGDDGADSPATTSESTMPAVQYAKRADELCAQVATKVVDARIQQRLARIEQSDASEQAKLERPRRSSPSSFG